MNKSTLPKIILSIAIGLGVVGFFFQSSSSHSGYYKMVDEVVAAPQEWTGKAMKVHGWVEAGSITEEVVGQEMRRTFFLENKGQRLLVRHVGPKPDTFRDKAEVVADGKVVIENGAAVLEANSLMAKCPSKYEGAPRDKLFENR